MDFIINSKFIIIIYQILMRGYFGGCSFFRKIFPFGKYKYLKKYKNIHDGERCFIICTGPSLKYEDVQLIKNEKTFSMNSISLWFNKGVWRPTYYGIQDINVYEKIKNSIINEKDIPIFCSSYLKKKCKDTPQWWHYFPYNGIYNSFELKFFNKMKVKFSDDISRMVYDGYTITYSIIQIAAYMGFKEMYLLGADCNYIPGKANHFIDYGHHDSDERQMLVGNLMQYSYLYAKKYLEKRGVKIYNATRGGMLEVFPRVSLEDVL